ncbi:hypothetical protein D3C77_668790 [compost metagenome]
MRVGAQGADHQQMARAQFAGTLGEGDRQVEIDGAEGALRAGLLDRRAQAAEGGVDGAVQLRQQLAQVADRIVQARMLRQRPAGRRQHTLHGGLVEQPVEQVGAGQPGGSGQ